MAKAAPANFPYSHRTMDKVLEEENQRRSKWRKRYDENFRSLKRG